MNQQVSSKKQSIPWGRDGQIEFELPAGWQLMGRFVPEEVPPLTNPAYSLEESLDKPVGCPPLRELVKGKRRIVIIVDDISRPTPVRPLLQTLLDYLHRAGVDDNLMKLVAATGLHRIMDRADMVGKVGEEVLDRVKWESHNSRDRDRLVYLGRTDRGTPVYINRTVAAADLRILVGGIKPHPHAGYGGGYKLILPGVAGVKSIAANHAICAHPRYFFMLGSDPQSNPMRQDLEQAGQMLTGTSFLINIVQNSDMEIAGIFAGDPVAAHREGIKLAKKATSVTIPHQADVVISNSYPMDGDLRQGIKAIADVIFAAGPGGIVLAALRCEEGMGNMRIPRIKLSGQPDFIWKPLVWMMSVLITQFAPPGISPEERFSTYFMLRALLRNRIFVYAPAIADQARGLLPGVKLFTDFKLALEEAERACPRASVIIFPHGGSICPQISKAM
jgi:nickel-dependent lactate racemase